MSTLFIVCGISFAGKTVLGCAIAQRFSFAEVDVDATKQELYGPDVSDDDLTDADWQRIYRATDAAIESHLKAGRSVVDASRNFRKAERVATRNLALAAGATAVTIFVDTPAAVARQRWLTNKQTRTRRDLTAQAFEQIIQGTEPPGDDEVPIVFHDGDDVQEWIDKNAFVFGG